MNSAVNNAVRRNIFMYTGNAHYNQMTSALNGDVTKTQTSSLLSGDDYKDMYLMIDHGLFAELGRRWTAWGPSV